MLRILKIRAIRLLIILAAFQPLAYADERTIDLSAALGMPYVSIDDNNGFVTELVKEVFTRAGLKMRVRILPEERSLRNANSGFSDGVLFRVGEIGQYYPNLVRVPGTIIKMEFTGFTRPNSSVSINGWGSLKPYSVGHVTGWKIYESNIRHVKAKIEVQNLELLFGLLQSQRVDIILVNRLLGNYVSNHLGIPARPLEPILATRSSHIFLHKSHKNLIPTLATELEATKKDGTYQKLYDRLIKPYRQNPLVFPKP